MISTLIRLLRDRVAVYRHVMGYMGWTLPISSSTFNARSAPYITTVVLMTKIVDIIDYLGRWKGCNILMVPRLRMFARLPG